MKDIASVTLTCHISISVENLARERDTVKSNLGISVIEFSQALQLYLVDHAEKPTEKRDRDVDHAGPQGTLQTGVCIFVSIPLRFRRNESVKKAQRKVNVGQWTVPPKIEQQQHPIRARIPCPELWIEVFNDDDYNDRERALSKLKDVRESVALLGAGKPQPEFVAIALPDCMSAQLPTQPDHSDLKAVPKEKLRGHTSFTGLQVKRTGSFTI